MKNIPRIFAGNNIQTGDKIAVGREISHYLGRVMRTNSCLAFGGGYEFNAQLTPDSKYLVIGNQTNHIDPSNNLTLMFAPIKHTNDLINNATQMGVKYLQPVITDRTNTNHINWARMQKIAVEAAEQSNRNSVPEILPVKKFSDLDLSNTVFADERAAHGHNILPFTAPVTSILIGPEGGFSDTEFIALDNAGAHGISLGKTILRAELAAAIAIHWVLK